MTPCSIPGCENPTLARGWCNKHYQRWRNHGDPTYLKPTRGWPKGKPRGVRQGCSMRNCKRPNKARGYCGLHYQRWLKHGDAAIVIDQATKGIPSYRTMHRWLGIRKTGRCSTPGCERIDTEMALIRGRGHLRQAQSSKPWLYSDHFEDYIELCARCHNLYDEREGWRLRQRAKERSLRNARLGLA